MAYCDVYIGELDDPKFSWDKGEWANNIPRPISPFFPPIKGQDDLPYRMVIDRIKDGILDGKQTDFAGWVARMSKQEIEAFANELYGFPPHYKGKYRLKEVQRLYDCILKLDPVKKYALVATTDSGKLFE